MPFTPPTTPDEVTYKVYYCEIAYQGMSGLEIEYYTLAEGFGDISVRAAEAWQHLMDPAVTQNIQVQNGEMFIPQGSWLSVAGPKQYIKTYDLSGLTPTITTYP